MPVNVEKVTLENFKVGQYVFACKYGDADPHDPWRVDFIHSIVIDRKGACLCFQSDGVRAFNYAKAITREEGNKILTTYTSQEQGRPATTTVFDVSN